VNITNNSSPAGLLITGTNQQVGKIDGDGSTQINPGGDLTANHIIQSALVIGGTSSSHGKVTIAASDPMGNPLDSLAVPATSLVSESPLTHGGNLGSSIGDEINGDPATALYAPLSSGPATGTAGVPEPSSLILLAISALGGACAAVRRQRRF
jgi:hypothetical protein